MCQAGSSLQRFSGSTGHKGHPGQDNSPPQGTSNYSQRIMLFGSWGHRICREPAGTQGEHENCTQLEVEFRPPRLENIALTSKLPCTPDVMHNVIVTPNIDVLPLPESFRFYRPAGPQ